METEPKLDWPLLARYLVHRQFRTKASLPNTQQFRREVAIRFVCDAASLGGMGLARDSRQIEALIQAVLLSFEEESFWRTVAATLQEEPKITIPPRPKNVRIPTERGVSEALADELWRRYHEEKGDELTLARLVRKVLPADADDVLVDGASRYLRNLVQGIPQDLYHMDDFRALREPDDGTIIPDGNWEPKPTVEPVKKENVFSWKLILLIGISVALLIFGIVVRWVR